jgi:valyl-tRNA synthetase
MMNIEEEEIASISSILKDFNLNSDRVEKTKNHIENVKRHFDDHRYNLASESIREFFWGEYCDKWIEEVKKDISEEKAGSEKRIQLLSELVYILKENLKIMHPMIPYITEAVWQELVKFGLIDESYLIIQQI